MHWFNACVLVWNKNTFSDISSMGAMGALAHSALHLYNVKYLWPLPHTPWECFWMEAAPPPTLPTFTHPYPTLTPRWSLTIVSSTIIIWAVLNKQTMRCLLAFQGSTTVQRADTIVWVEAFFLTWFRSNACTNMADLVLIYIGVCRLRNGHMTREKAHYHMSTERDCRWKT